MHESSALSSPPSGSPSPTASFAGSSATSRPRRSRSSKRKERGQAPFGNGASPPSQQALRVHIHVVAEPPYSPALLHFRERRLHGLPQRRPVQTLHRELPTHATARAGGDGRDRTQYFEVWRTHADRKSGGQGEGGR